MDAKGFCKDDFIPCEKCGSRASDIHHKIFKSKDKSKENDIDNLEALCRSCHDKVHNNKNNSLLYQK